MAGMMQYNFFPTDFYYPKPTPTDDRVPPSKAEAPDSGKDSVVSPGKHFGRYEVVKVRPLTIRYIPAQSLSFVKT